MVVVTIIERRFNPFTGKITACMKRFKNKDRKLEEALRDFGKQNRGYGTMEFHFRLLDEKE